MQNLTYQKLQYLIPLLAADSINIYSDLDSVKKLQIAGEGQEMNYDRKTIPWLGVQRKTVMRWLVLILNHP